MEDIRTAHEQQIDLHPSNLFTSCFYKYLAAAPAPAPAPASSPKNAEQITQTTQRWKHTNDIYKFYNLVCRYV